MRIFYTGSDIEDLAASGVKQLEVGPGVTLTGAARERAEELGIALVTPGGTVARKAAAPAAVVTAQSGAARGVALPARPRGCQHGPLAVVKGSQGQAAAAGGPVVEQLVEAVSALKGQGEAKMRIAKVVGVAVATVKDQRLEGVKLLLVAEADPTGVTTGRPFVALDKVGAGDGELVLVVDGSSARTAAGDASRPVDAVIVGILDSLRHEGQMSYQKS